MDSLRSSQHHLSIAKNRVKTGRPESSSTVADHMEWLALWDTGTPNKAKNHTWWLMCNGLVVGAELLHRHIKMGVFCAVCGREETLYLRFWECHQHCSGNSCTRNWELRWRSCRFRQALRVHYLDGCHCGLLALQKRTEPQWCRVFMHSG